MKKYLHIFKTKKKRGYCSDFILFFWPVKKFGNIKLARLRNPLENP